MGYLTRLCFLAALLWVLPAQAASSQLTYTLGLIQDQNVVTQMSPLPVDFVGAPPYMQPVGNPVTGLRFTQAGSYKVVTTYLVASDPNNASWSYNMDLVLATSGTFVMPVITQPITMVPAFLPTTYTATMTVDALTVSVGDVLSFFCSVRPTNATPYSVSPKVYRGLASTNLAITALY